MPHKIIQRRIVQHSDHWFMEETERYHPLRMEDLEGILSYMLEMQTVCGHSHDPAFTESAHIVVVVVPLHGREQERHYLAEWRCGRTVTRLPDRE